MAGEVFMTRRGSLSVPPCYRALQWKHYTCHHLKKLGLGFIDLCQEWLFRRWSLGKRYMVIDPRYHWFCAGLPVWYSMGFAMGLNSWLRGWFEPIVEFMRPVPPLH